MRAECISAIESIALEDPRVIVVASDPGMDFMAKLAAAHPERLMIEGICEQALAGVAAGLASEGHYPFIVTLAVFATRRCYEQLLLDFGLHRLSGCVVGTGGGLNYSVLGPTHLAVDDFALVSSIPRSAVLAPGDPSESTQLPRCAMSHRGLSYIRLAETTAALNDAIGPVVFGRGRPLSPPGKILLISCGAASLATQAALKILNLLPGTVGAIHLHTVKPLDVELISRYANAASTVLCIEEHRQIGGLSSAVLHALSAMRRPLPAFVSIGIDDEFPEGYGTYQEMMARYGLTGAAIADKTREHLARN